MNPDPAQINLPTPWRDEWGPLPSQELRGKVGSYLETEDDFSKVKFDYGDDGTPRLAQFRQSFAEDELPQAFQLIFLTSKESAYRILADTKGDHLGFGRRVTKPLPEEFFEFFLETALEDTTRGSNRDPIELAETVYCSHHFSEGFQNLSPCNLSRLLIHLIRDLEALEIKDAAGGIEGLIERALEKSDRAALKEAISSFTDPDILAFLRTFSQSKLMPGPSAREVQKIAEKALAVRPFCNSTVESDPDVEQFIADNSEEFGKGQTLSSARSIRYNPQLARGFLKAFPPGGRLAEAYRCIYYNYPELALTIILSTKGRHEHMAEMLSLCPEDAAFQVAEREVEDSAWLTEEERERYEQLSGGSAVKLLLQQRNGSGPAVTCFDLRVFSPLFSHDDFNSLLGLCFVLDREENSDIRSRITDALSGAHYGISGRDPLVSKSEIQKALGGLFGDDDKLERTWKQLFARGFLEREERDLAVVTEKIQFEPESLKPALKEDKDLLMWDWQILKVLELLRRTVRIPEDVRAWLRESPLCGIPSSRQDAGEVKILTSGIIRKQLENQEVKGFAVAPSQSRDEEVSLPAAGFFFELGVRGYPFFYLTPDSGRWGAYSHEISSLFFEMIPQEKWAEVFPVVYHQSPMVGGIIACSRKHHSRTWSLFSQLPPGDTARVIEAKLGNITDWENSGAMPLFFQFDNCALARVLLAADDPDYFASVIDCLPVNTVASLFTHFHMINTRLDVARMYDMQGLRRKLGGSMAVAVLEDKICQALSTCSDEVRNWALATVAPDGVRKKVARTEIRQRLESEEPEASGELKRWEQYHYSSVPRIEVAASLKTASVKIIELLQGDPRIKEEDRVPLEELLSDDPESALSRFAGLFEKDIRDSSFDAGAAAEAWYTLGQGVSALMKRHEFKSWKDVFERSCFIQYVELAGFLDNHFSTVLGAGMGSGMQLEVQPAHVPEDFDSATGRIRVVDSENHEVSDAQLGGLTAADLVVVREYPSNYSATGDASGIITGAPTGEFSHALHRARELDVVHCHFPQAEKAFRDLQDTWVTVRRKRDGIFAVEKASMAEKVARISERVPGFVPDQLLPSKDRVITTSHREKNQAHYTGMKAARIGESQEIFPDDTERDTVASTFGLFFEAANRRVARGCFTLGELIQDTIRNVPLSTIEGRNFASMKIQNWFDRQRFSTEVFALWDNLRSVFGDGTSITEGFMMRVSMNLEDRRGVSATGVHLSLPVLPYASREDIEARLRMLFKSGFTPDALLLRENAGISHIETGVAVVCERMPDFEKHMVVSGNVLVDGEGVTAGFCIGHGNYMMAEGNPPAFTLHYSRVSGDISIKRSVAGQSVKQIPQDSISDPYQTVSLTEAEAALAADPEDMPVGLRTKLETRLIPQAEELFRRHSSIGQEMEVTVEEMNYPEWQLRHRQQRPMR